MLHKKHRSGFGVPQKVPALDGEIPPPKPVSVLERFCTFGSSALPGEDSYHRLFLLRKIGVLFEWKKHKNKSMFESKHHVNKIKRTDHIQHTHSTSLESPHRLPADFCTSAPSPNAPSWMRVSKSTRIASTIATMISIYFNIFQCQFLPDPTQAVNSVNSST